MSIRTAWNALGKLIGFALQLAFVYASVLGVIAGLEMLGL
jgi:hypothetical protein